MTRWLYLWCSYRELADGGGSVGRYAGGWSNIQESTRNCENEATTDNPRCMLYLVYAALSVNSRWWHGEIERDDLTLCSCDDGRVVDKKERDEDEDESDMEDTSGYEKSGVRLAWLGVEETWLGLEDIISVFLPAGSRLVPAVSRMVSLTRTRSSLKSQFLMMHSPISSDLSLSCAQLYHHQRTVS